MTLINAENSIEVDMVMQKRGLKKLKNSPGFYGMFCLAVSSQRVII